MTPSFEVTSAIYEVDNEGDLTIHVTGRLTSTSVDTCQFHLEIPDDFEIGTLNDGSPQVEIKNAGSSSMLISNDDQIEVKFLMFVCYV